MSVKFHRHNFLPPTSTSPQWVAQKSSSVQYVYRVVDFDNYPTSQWPSSRRRHLRFTHFENRTNGKSCKYLRVQSHHDLFSHKSKRVRNLIIFSASSDDGVTLNGSSKSSMSRDVEAMRIRLNEALQNGDYNDGLVQALHDAARVFELLLKERSSLSKISWFSSPWFGVDNNGWTKSLSYQASLYALLQAAVEMSSRGDGRDRDVNVIVQKSLLRLSAPLESIIREKFSGKQPLDVDWFWSDKMPVVVTTFVDHFKRDPRFKSATMSGKRTSTGSVNASDISLIVLALVCTSMIMKLGPAKVSSSQLFSIVPDITSSLMGVLVGLMPIHETYHVVKEIGLHREFLIHFGPRAASCGVTDNCISDEIVFWVDLVQKQLQRAIDKEKIWSRLTTSESIEVLERDLAIFGFFVALGRSTRSFLASNGFDKIDEPIEGFIRYLIGGCIIFYPQLSSISSYELYVEVICEELDWFSFYPGYDNTVKRSYGHKSKSEVPLNVEAVSQALDVCSHWIRVFIKHSKWVDNPSNVKAARFLSKGHDKLEECKEKLGLLNKAQKSFDSAESSSDVQSRDEPYSFDKALESVEETLLRLEKLIQEMHVSSVGSGKELLKAACSDLEKIRRLKKEAEFLEMSFRAKADSLQEENKGVGAVIQDKNNSKRAGFWAFLVRFPWKKPSLEYSEIADTITDTSSGSPNADVKSDADEIHRFKLLRSELMELEKRVQRSATQSQNEENIDYTNTVKGVQLVPMQKNESFMGKSLAKLKETSTDVWQGTQLLAIDVAASTCLLRRTIIGDELTEKEKKFLRRTLTDLASVVPIGFLMLLPVTAVGHAAMLAAIRRYAPALIPSTYGQERLDLLRQVQKMKQSDTGEANNERNMEEIA